MWLPRSGWGYLYLLQRKEIIMNDPAFTIALALALGMIAQSAARHINIPGIV